MNFQKIPPVETSKIMLDLAFRKAREKGKSKNLKGNWLQKIRQKEALKIDVVHATINPRLQKILADFPGEEALSPFYQQLIKLTLDYPNYKKSFGAVHWAIKKISSLHGSYVRMIIKEKDRQEIKNIIKQYYGRLSSILKQIDPNLKLLEKSRKIMRSYPDIKDLYTICIYGFPNVGKTTLLNKLTKTKAKTAAYAFTTITINAGYITTNNQKIQVLDVPGTLARENKMNPIELQAELVLNEVADFIIYVFDITERCGFSLAQQQKLYQKIKNKSHLVYISKQDLLTDKDVVDNRIPLLSLSQIKKKISSLVKDEKTKEEE